MNADEAALIVNLLPAGAALPEGQPLKGTAGLKASLDHVGVQVRLNISPPPGACSAEIRWLVDGCLRKLLGLIDLSNGAIHFIAADVDSALATTLALDLQARAPDGVLHELGAPVDALADSLATYRQWVDEDPTVRTSIRIGEDVTRWTEAFSGAGEVSVQVYDAEAIDRLGMNLLTAVGGASTVSPPRLVIAHYKPAADEPAGAKPARKPWMLLGKGITFDSGGINVKPYESFVSMMKNDMAGAALAWSLFKHLAEAGVSRPLTLVIPTCENPIGEQAMRPGAVVKSYRGPTVRIDHTDAEGRLVLADALAYATEQHPPEKVFCFATLTTAALIAYGPYATPVHFADRTIQDAMETASDATGEDLHFFPYRAWHREANTDKIANLRNTGRLPGNASRGAGSRNAAHFLLNFTDLEAGDFVHLDIFASTWNWAGDAPGAGVGATGAPLRTLIEAMTALS